MGYQLLSAGPAGAASRTRFAVREGRRKVVLRDLQEGVQAFHSVVSSPDVLALMEVTTVGGVRSAVYDFIDGVTLGEVVEALQDSEQPVPLGLVGRVVLDGARAMSAIHGTQPPAPAHGGLGDSSLLIGFDGVVRVMDYGAPRPGRFQLAGMKDVPADVFALAAVLHAALTDFAGNYSDAVAEGVPLPQPSRLHDEVNEALDDVVMRALSRVAWKRQVDARHFSEELDAALAGTLFSPKELGAAVAALFPDRAAGQGAARVALDGDGVGLGEEDEAPTSSHLVVPNAGTSPSLPPVPDRLVPVPGKVPWVTGKTDGDLPNVIDPEAEDGGIPEGTQPAYVLPARIPTDTQPGQPGPVVVAQKLRPVSPGGEVETVMARPSAPEAPPLPRPSAPPQASAGAPPMLRPSAPGGPPMLYASPPAGPVIQRPAAPMGPPPVLLPAAAPSRPSAPAAPVPRPSTPAAPVSRPRTTGSNEAARKAPLPVDTQEETGPGARLRAPGPADTADDGESPAVGEGEVEATRPRASRPAAARAPVREEQAFEADDGRAPAWSGDDWGDGELGQNTTEEERAAARGQERIATPPLGTPAADDQELFGDLPDGEGIEDEPTSIKRRPRAVEEELAREAAEAEGADLHESSVKPPRRSSRTVIMLLLLVLAGGLVATAVLRPDKIELLKQRLGLKPPPQEEEEPPPDDGEAFTVDAGDAAPPDGGPAGAAVAQPADAGGEEDPDGGFEDDLDGGEDEEDDGGVDEGEGEGDAGTLQSDAGPGKKQPVKKKKRRKRRRRR